MHHVQHKELSCEFKAGLKLENQFNWPHLDIKEKINKGLIISTRCKKLIN